MRQETRQDTPAPPALPELALGAVLALATAKLLLHVVVNILTPYEFHRDELLYMAMGEHLRLWHMDFPPLIAMLSRGARGILGDSLFAIRLVPAITGALLVAAGSLVARELGGGRRAQALTALALLLNPLFLRSGNLFQPVVLDQLFWTFALLALARVARVREHDRRAAARAWILLGIACGLGLLAKFSILLLGASIAIAVIVTPLRRELATPWPWIAFAIAFLIGSPSIVGQLLLGFPLRDQMADLRASQLGRVTPGAFYGEQLLWGPGTLLAFAGVIVLLVADRMRSFRVVGAAALIAFLVFTVLHGKAYYAAALHPTLIAASMVLLGNAHARVWQAPLRWITAAAIVVYGLVTLPLGLPILRPVVMERYVDRLGATAVNRNNAGGMERLPQDYADMLGWEQQARTMARVYNELPPDDRHRVVIIAGNYGQAGALDYYGPRLGLPPSVLPSGTYWFFGPGEKPGEVALVMALDDDLEELSGYFRSTRVAATISNAYAVTGERHVNIVLARSPYRTLQELWPGFAHRN